MNSRSRYVPRARQRAETLVLVVVPIRTKPEAHAPTSADTYVKLPVDFSTLDLSRFRLLTYEVRLPLTYHKLYALKRGAVEIRNIPA
jgi:hypothetical protein